MTTVTLMDRKKKANIFSFGSIFDEFDRLAKAGERGDKSLLGSVGCFLVLKLSPQDREDLMRTMNRAYADSRFGGTVLEEMNRLWDRRVELRPVSQQAEDRGRDERGGRPVSPKGPDGNSPGSSAGVRGDKLRGRVRKALDGTGKAPEVKSEHPPRLKEAD